MYATPRPARANQGLMRQVHQASMPGGQPAGPKRLYAGDSISCRNLDGLTPVHALKARVNERVSS